MVVKRQLFSRRALLRSAGIVAVYPIDAIAMQNAAGYGVTALLDGTGMARIPPGEFQMGSPNGNADERPVHRVRISQGFEMGKCEVTQAQWEAVMGNAHVGAGATLVNADGGTVSRKPSRFEGASLPVDSVSWEDVALFLKRLNARDTRHAWRLPTEAEWEYACKAGGTQEAGIEAIAWYKANSDDQTQPVATKEPNAWGLYDMHGNVAEWVHDWYSPDYYENSSAVDPKGPEAAPETGSYRVFRGSCWHNTSENCRAAIRGFDFPVSRFDYVGFRLVRTAR
jgi:formylglycine-generating enzyme required for sulfatase activity